MAEEFFTGIEAEGVFRGLKTLFVPASSMYHDLGYVIGLAKEHDCTHVYLGARGELLSPDDIENIMGENITSESALLWTIEVEDEQAPRLPAQLLQMKNLRIMLTKKLREADLAHLSLCDHVEFKLDGTKTAALFQNVQIIDTTYAHDRDI